ncbi:hypothetical protein F4604DRAFT_848110 [Suillus subluteus]|nr:hypothetical protein F4604DRAFT_848110 [Suillus subluteus]
MDPQFIAVAKRIRTLSMMLYNIGHCIESTPTQNPAKTLSERFMEHFVNLLTTGDKKSPAANKVIAVTGMIPEAAQSTTIPQTVLITRNTFHGSPLTQLVFQHVYKSTKTFQQIVDSDDDAIFFERHVSDIWTALASFEDTEENFTSLCTFVVRRCRRKLFHRISLLGGKTLRGVNVAQMMSNWTPTANELSKTFWHDTPTWLHKIDLPREKLEGVMCGQGQVEFSNKTVRFLGWLLSHLILLLESDAKEAKETKKDSDMVRFKEAVTKLSHHCLLLFQYIYWDANIVETLLTKTTLASSFKLPMPGDKIQESSGTRVFGDLKTITAWHAALWTFRSPSYVEIFKHTSIIGSVDFPYPDSDIANVDEIFSAYSDHFPDWESTDEDFLQKHHPTDFHGTVHAEAILMGLLTYFSPSKSAFNPSGLDMHSDGALVLQELLEPVSANGVITVSKKFCWCCSRLGLLLKDNGEHLVLPGSHGVVYPWSPPLVGVDIERLHELEQGLLAELRNATRKTESLPSTRQTSGPNSVA